ncbi:hypothetical protein J6590_089163 [Homalodisca vitripennis]|nr:hypothetical protein J6590_089163 [Homalodisca vitripennis]
MSLYEQGCRFDTITDSSRGLWNHLAFSEPHLQLTCCLGHGIADSDQSADSVKAAITELSVRRITLLRCFGACNPGFTCVQLIIGMNCDCVMLEYTEPTLTGYGPIEAVTSGYSLSLSAAFVRRICLPLALHVVGPPSIHLWTLDAVLIVNSFTPVY